MTPLADIGRIAAATLTLAAMSVWVAPQAAHAVSTRLLLSPAGDGSLDRFGSYVSNAGDVNGDGYDDVIVGAPKEDNIGSNDGRAYVFFGGPLADDVPDWILDAEASGEEFGGSVSGAGDVNGDGFDDVIVGARYNDATASNAGRAYVFYGGVAPDIVSDITVSGAAGDDQFGISVSGAGDMNGDGYDDVIVGAHQNDDAGVNAGRAYVFFGGPGLALPLLLDGEVAGDFFGESVSDAGDVNGDGYGDVIAGTRLNDAGGSNAGRAYIYFGGPLPDNTADVMLTGGNGDQLGSSVSGAGDFNGDGYDDVVVGAPWSDGGTSNGGAAAIYYGGSPMDTAVDVSLYGENSLDNLGDFVSDAGDINNDGYDDIIAGAPEYNGTANDIGAAYVLFGGAAADNVYDIVVKGSESDDRFGEGVGGGGDLTGDGFADFIVGVQLADAPGPDQGRAHVYDAFRYLIGSPNGGETWPVGSSQFISWSGNDRADVWLSTDGGLTFDLLRYDVGGEYDNAVPVRVPHAPSRFAMVRLTPMDPALSGADHSDSSFTIESSVSLLTFTVAAQPGGGANLAWASQPAVGPQGIAGYRLYRSAAGIQAGGVGTQIGPSLITGTSYIDAGGNQGARYRLTAVNGLGHELELGREMLAPGAPLAAWPMPYHGGVLNVSFASASGLGGGGGQVEVGLFDAAGRRVRTLASGTFTPGFHTTSWDGRDRSGQRVAAGMYFLRLMTGGEVRQMKVVVAE